MSGPTLWTKWLRLWWVYLHEGTYAFSGWVTERWPVTSLDTRKVQSRSSNVFSYSSRPRPSVWSELRMCGSVFDEGEGPYWKGDKNETTWGSRGSSRSSHHWEVTSEEITRVPKPPREKPLGVVNDVGREYPEKCYWCYIEDGEVEVGTRGPVLVRTEGRREVSWWVKTKSINSKHVPIQHLRSWFLRSLGTSDWTSVT